MPSASVPVSVRSVTVTPDLVGEDFRGRVREHRADACRASGRLGRAPDVQRRADLPLLGLGEPAADVEVPAVVLAPLAERWVADPGKLPFGFSLKDGADGKALRCDARVPDRPAESRLNSFIAAVHRQYDGQAAGQWACELAAHGLDRQAAVPCQRKRLMPVQRDSPSACPGMAARSSSSASAATLSGGTLTATPNPTETAADPSG